MDMQAGYLYIMQYLNVIFFKTGRAVNARRRLLQKDPGTVLHLAVVTSDMRAAEARSCAQVSS